MYFFVLTIISKNYPSSRYFFEAGRLFSVVRLKNFSPFGHNPLILSFPLPSFLALPALSTHFAFSQSRMLFINFTCERTYYSPYILSFPGGWCNSVHSSLFSPFHPFPSPPHDIFRPVSSVLPPRSRIQARFFTFTCPRDSGTMEARFIHISSVRCGAIRTIGKSGQNRRSLTSTVNGDNGAMTHWPTAEKGRPRMIRQPGDLPDGSL